MSLLSVENPQTPQAAAALDTTTTEEERRLSELIRQSYSKPTPAQAEEVIMSQKDFSGVKELFDTFVHNRACNLKAFARQKAQRRLVDTDVTFAPQINQASNEMATTLMQRYWKKTAQDEEEPVDVPADIDSVREQILENQRHLTEAL